MNLQMDDETTRTESSQGGETSVSEVDTNHEPYVGMSFASEEVARAFYDDYALRTGFSTHVLSSRKSECDRLVVSRAIGCSSGGSYYSQAKAPSRKQDGQHKICRARILLNKDKTGRWIIKKFVRDHNHLLVDQLQKGRRKFDEKDRRILELTAELRLKKRLTEIYKEQLVAFLKDVEEHNDNLSKRVRLAYEHLRKLEATEKEILLNR